MSACALVLASAATAPSAHAATRDVTFAVTMTNDAVSNEIKVYDAHTGALLQTLSTHGKGGTAGNARGIRRDGGDLVAVVNNGSSAVALFRRVGFGLQFQQLVTTTSAPVSVDFGNGHMYVAGATTVDSFVMHGHSVGALDGTTALQLAGGGLPPEGSTAQVEVLDTSRLLVTLKTDPDPGTVDVVSLDDGAVRNVAPTAVSAPAGTLTPFGFSVYKDGTAIITLAHSSQLGVFRDGAFVSVVAAGQAADCWSTRVGKYIFTANTGSHTISRLVGTGHHVFVDDAVAASVAGAPSDIDADAGILGVIDRAAGQSRLTFFTYNRFGELTISGTPIAIGAPNANGIAIMPADDGRR